MIKFLLIIFALMLIISMFQNHIKIKWSTFFKKGFKINNGKYGVYCYCGKQGMGKTFSVCSYLLDNKDKEIYSNVPIIGVKYTPIGSFDDLLELRSKRNCIIFYDEIFTALTKQSSITTEVLDFLSQMRKREIIFLTTAQEWLEINMTLRRYCRYQIQCRMFSVPILNFGILIKQFNDAEQMKWSKDDNEYIAPTIETTISKANLYVAQSYDTFYQIKTSSSMKNNKLKKSLTVKK